MKFYLIRSNLFNCFFIVSFSGGSDDFTTGINQFTDNYDVLSLSF